MVRTGHHFNAPPEFHDDDRVYGLSDAALALWILAGTYCVSHLMDDGDTDGRISPARIERLRPETGEEAAKELVKAGLWTKLTGKQRGYRFVDWEQTQQTKAERENYLKRDAARKKKARADAKSETPRSRGKTSTRTPNGRGTDVRADSDKESAPPSGRTSARTPSGVPRIEVDKEIDRDKNLDVDGHLSAQTETRAREAVDNSRPAGWRAARCTDHQNAAEPLDDCPGCAASVAAQRRIEVRQAADERRAEATAEQARRAEAARDCGQCDETGFIDGRRCTHHRPGGRQRAEAALAAAAAEQASKAPAEPEADETDTATDAESAVTGTAEAAPAEAALAAAAAEQPQSSRKPRLADVHDLHEAAGAVHGAHAPGSHNEKPSQLEAISARDTDAAAQPTHAQPGTATSEAPDVAGVYPITPAIRRYTDPPRRARAIAATNTLLIQPGAHA